MNFDNVHLDGWWSDMQWTFISEFAHGSVTNTSPDPLLNEKSHRVFNLYSFESALAFVQQAVGFYNKNHTDILGWQTLFGIVLWAATLSFDGGNF